MALDNKNIEILYTELRPWIEWFARANHKSKNYAEDLLQDTMVNILGTKESIRPETMLDYAKEVARNLLRDSRKKKNIPVEPLVPDNIKHTAVYKRTGNQLISADFPRGYFTGIEEATVAMGLEGFTQEEIAKKLKKSRSSVVRALDSAIIKANQ